MIPVTKPFLPPIEQYEAYVKGIWERNWLTNNGPLVNELESKLKEYLKVKHMLFMTNGTIAIQIAIKALGLKGKIITTPFSYVATTSSIVWENCEPVFADIDKNTFNIDPAKIEELITPDTSAILATHVYGNACDVTAIEGIAKRHQLRVIYDAAHAFGTLFKGKSMFEYGDVSTASFHATKLFHTIEGGAVFTHDPELLKKMTFMRNFGHHGPSNFAGIGINGKNSEFHAAMGLCNLHYVNEILEKRKEQSLYYDSILKNVRVKKPAIQENCDFNYAYYPILFESEEALVKTQTELEKKMVQPRRYFYPSLSKLPYVQGNTPISDNIASRVLCLPLYFTLRKEEQEYVGEIMMNAQNY